MLLGKLKSDWWPPWGGRDPWGAGGPPRFSGFGLHGLPLLLPWRLGGFRPSNPLLSNFHSQWGRWVCGAPPLFFEAVIWCSTEDGVREEGRVRRPPRREPPPYLGPQP